MLNFNDSTLCKLNISTPESTKPKLENIKFYNSLYNKNSLSDYILVEKVPRKIKPKISEKN